MALSTAKKGLRLFHVVCVGISLNLAHNYANYCIVNVKHTWKTAMPIRVSVITIILNDHHLATHIKFYCFFFMDLQLWRQMHNLNTKQCTDETCSWGFSSV